MAKAVKKLFSPGPKSDKQLHWSKQGVLELKEKVKVKASRMLPDQEPPRILFIGETGSGKSSFISSVISALSGDVTYSAMIGEKEGGEENTSKRYLEYRVFMGEEKEPLNFILCDARGIGKKNQLGVADREIERLMDGKLRHNDLIESDRDSNGTLIDNRDPKPPSCVVFVQKATRLGELDTDIQEKLNKAADITRGRGIPCSVILTHIDVVKPSLTKNLHKALRNRTLQECVQRAAKEVGVNTNRVFLVKNYTTEEKTHVRHDILILRALHSILVDVSARHRLPGAASGGQQTQLNRNHSEPEEAAAAAHNLRHLAGYRRSPDEHDRSSVGEISTTDSGISSAGSVESRLHPRNERPMVYQSHSPHRIASEPSQLGRVSGPLLGRAGYGDMRSSEGTKPKSVRVSEETVPKSVRVSKETMPQPVQVSEETVPEPQLLRGEQFLEYYIPKNRTSQKTYEGSNSEYDSEESESDTDEGVGCSESLSEEESGQSNTSYLRRTIEALADHPFPEEYNEKANLRGAKALFQPTVQQLIHTNKTTTDADGKLSLQLPKSYADKGSFHKDVYKTMQEFSGTNSASLWMSYTLPTDLGLPVDTLPPTSTDLQIFFLSPEHPPFLLTIFDPEKTRLKNVGEDLNIPSKEPTMKFNNGEPVGVCEEITLPVFHGEQLNQPLTSEADWQGVIRSELEKVKLYTVQMGKLLTAALLDYCSRDFLLLPCCLSKANFSLDRLKEELEQQRKLARQCYGGPLDLSLAAYQELKAAAVAVTGVSSVPPLFAEQRPEKDQGEQDLVLMDPDWRAAVSLLVETLEANESCELLYSPDSGFKTQVAVVEAVKRLSFVDPVTLFTSSRWLQNSCRELKKKVLEDTGVTLKLTALLPGDDAQAEADDVKQPTYVILLDCLPSERDRVELRGSRATVTVSESQNRDTYLIKEWV